MSDKSPARQEKRLRERSYLLTESGVKRLDVAAREYLQKGGNKFSINRAAKTAGVSHGTYSKAIKREGGNDLEKLRMIFKAFDLTLESNDFILIKIVDKKLFKNQAKNTRKIKHINDKVSLDRQQINIVKQALKSRKYSSQKQFALRENIEPFLVNLFFQGKTIDFKDFVDICQKLELQWEMVIDAKYFEALEQPYKKEDYKKKVGLKYVDSTLNNIPQYGTQVFLGRDQELVELHNQLEDSSEFFVVGMGGIGKTEFVRRYALQQQHFYKGGICWVDLRHDNFVSRIIGFASTFLNVNLPQQIKDEKDQILYCWRNWFNNVNRGNVLIIIDDLVSFEDYKQLQHYLPSPSFSSFKILFTSRK